MRNLPDIRRRDVLKGAGAVILSTGIGLPATAKNLANQDVLRLSVSQAVANLNPLLARVKSEYLVAECLYSGLTRLSSDMSSVPDLTESWTSTDDLTVWTFKLRPNLVFHDGTPLTSADVVATFRAILDAATGSPGRRNVGPIVDIMARDDRTVVFTLSSPYADLAIALAYPNAKIIPGRFASQGLARLNATAIGTGPFRLVQYEGERLIVVERNPTYHHPPRPLLDRVEIVVYPDQSAERSALMSGDTDMMISVAATEFQELKEIPNVDALRTTSGKFCNIIMANDRKPFDDARVRQALALTVDRNAMVEFVAEGYGMPGNDTPLNSAYHRHYESLPFKPRRIQRARELLSEAGYPDGLRLELIASDRPYQRIPLAVALRAMAKPAGFDIEIRTMTHATYLAQVWKKGPFYVGVYNGQATADAIFSLLYTSDAPWNETRWNNHDFDANVKAAKSTTNDLRRNKLYSRAQKLMYDEVPSIIPVFLDLLAAKRDYVKGYNLHPRGAVFNLDQIWIDKLNIGGT